MCLLFSSKAFDVNTVTYTQARPQVLLVVSRRGSVDIEGCSAWGYYSCLIHGVYGNPVGFLVFILSGADGQLVAIQLVFVYSF